MSRFGRCAFFLVLLFLSANNAQAQTLSMRWGLENTWSYRETQRSFDLTPQPGGKVYRTFEFAENRSEVLNPFLQCARRHSQLWKSYNNLTGEEKARLLPAEIPGGSNPEQAAFEAYKTQNDAFCIEVLKKQAPTLYFDFVADSPDQYVLERIEITTLRFSEYKGGGFARTEAWYDILLPHKEGTKTFNVQRRLVFSGNGRAQLRFWSDNFKPRHGWIAPMGEYLIDIRFVFSVTGRIISVTTGPFFIDV